MKITTTKNGFKLRAESKRENLVIASIINIIQKSNDRSYDFVPEDFGCYTTSEPFSAQNYVVIPKEIEVADGK